METPFQVSQDSPDWRNPGNNLFVNFLPWWTTEKDLWELFSTQGEVVESHVVRDFHTKESRGFAFVTMATTEDAKRCIKKFDHTVQFDRVIVVERSKRQRPRTPTPGKYSGTRYDHEQRRERSRSLSPVRKEDRYRFSSDRSRSQTPIQKEDSYSRDRRGRSPSPRTHRRRRD
ncbi:serine/arginine-rich splicing factor SR45a-like [Vigna radiata var. radiata]|uniref:Serine/arginine-rich splicing factor SR45a-like n=1 Tax=Vigna radiata var. radiata TaxID=3916 RepID=A0A3Q0FE85_VIGRR|nr:serine/arginine-rich splicing factor SR45a-like [Vigna radiata var. radiata]